MPKTPVTNYIGVDEFSTKYQLSDKIVYYVDKNNFCICPYVVISSQIQKCLPFGESLKLSCIKAGSILDSDKKNLYAGDCGVPGWTYSKRPQTLFNSFEECLDNMKKIVEHYTNGEIKWNTDFHDSYGYIQIPET